jgi:branched-chain amino acid transport system permease protein
VETLLTNLLHALQLSMLYFLLAVGLTLIFGLMDTLNLAHGGFYTIGAYVGWRITTWGGALLAMFFAEPGLNDFEFNRVALQYSTEFFWAALIIAPVFVGGAGYLFQRYVLHPLSERGRETHLDFALLTFGLLFVIMGSMELVFGTTPLSIGMPALLTGSIDLFGLNYPVYRLFIILMGIAIAILLYFVLDRTVWGAIVRAGVDNRDMVLGMGINITKVFAIVFAVGTGMAALAGVIYAPGASITATMGARILVVTFVIVVVGGLGNLTGSFYASLIVGFVDSLAQAYKPTVEIFGTEIQIDLELYGIYILLAVVLMIKPTGIFGSKGAT